jgi:hypothetical protein
MKKAGSDARVLITEVYRTMLGTAEASAAQNGPTSWPMAAPSGFARDATAVADTRPLSENQRLLYLVGALRTNGCAKPMMICPNITTPKWPPVARVPA